MEERIPLQVRAWLYRVTLALMPILTTYGLLSEQTAPMWIGLVVATLGLGTATAYTPTPPAPPKGRHALNE